MDVNEDVKQETQSTFSPLHKVTPLSKYLAMALFVVLPFIGGWIGYTYAPEKIVEVDRLVIREVEVVGDKNEEVKLNTFTAEDIISEKIEIIDWAEFDIAAMINPYVSNQIRWRYKGNIFSGLPAEKTYALFAIEDQEGEVVYSSIVGDGLSIDGSVTSTVWGGEPVVGTVEDLYGKLIEGERYRYKVTLGYASGPNQERAFKELAARHVSYSDWFIVDWNKSE